MNRKHHLTAACLVALLALAGCKRETAASPDVGPVADTQPVAGTPAEAAPAAEPAPEAGPSPAASAKRRQRRTSARLPKPNPWRPHPRR